MNIIRKVKYYLGRSTMEKDFLPQTKVLIGTHHKTGTAWLYSIFVEIAQKTGMKFYYGKEENLPDKYDIFFEEHSQFSEFFIRRNNYRGIHIIRDPRDIVISAVFYHQKSNEKWLHRPQDKFGGLTYQQKLNSIESFDGQVHFEMQNASYYETMAIKNWNYQNANFIEIKYEDLIQDSDLNLFHDIFVFLGYRKKSIPLCLDIAYKNSIFSGHVKKSVHVRSGKARQWEKYFTKKNRQRFLELHGDVLIHLGYEENHDWADRDKVSG